MRFRALRGSTQRSGLEKRLNVHPVVIKVNQLLERHAQFVLILILITGLIAIIASKLDNPALLKEMPADPWTIARNLYHGKGYTACSPDYFPFCAGTAQQTATREPVPVLMMLGAMYIYPDPISGYYLEAALYFIIILLLYFSLKPESKSFALLAAALWATSVVVIQEVGDGSGDIEAAFFVTCCVLLFQKGRSSDSWFYWALAGLFAGLAALSRSVLIPVIPGLAIGMLLEKRLGSLRTRMSGAAILVGVAAITIAPWLIRNQLVFGEPVVGTTLTGYNLYRENYFIAQPNWYPHYVGSKEAASAITSLVRESDLSGHENEAQMQAFYQGEAIPIILQHPAAYLGLSIFRFMPLWFDSSVKLAYGGTVNFQDVLMVIQQLFMLGSCILGAWLNRGKFWPYILVLIMTVAAYMAVTAQLRYLVDIIPVIAVLSASFFLPLLSPSKNGDNQPRTA
jgi:4-amino-4-deoxy-L-arabinose transferase-like glycosyltransferase